jgi:hypothetical protein
MRLAVFPQGSWAQARVKLDRRLTSHGAMDASCFTGLNQQKQTPTNRPIQYAKRPPEGSLFNVLRLDIIR